MALATSPEEHSVLIVLETSVGTELVATIANVDKVWLRLRVAVDKPREPSAGRECAGLSLSLPCEPEVHSHRADVVTGGREVAVAVILAEHNVGAGGHNCTLASKAITVHKVDT